MKKLILILLLIPVSAQAQVTSDTTTVVTTDTLYVDQVTKIINNTFVDTVIVTEIQVDTLYVTEFVTDTLYLNNTVYESIISTVDWIHKQSNPDEHILEIQWGGEFDTSWVEVNGQPWANPDTLFSSEITYIDVYGVKDNRFLQVRDSVDLATLNALFLSEMANNKYFTVTIPSTEVPSDQTDVPVYLDLSVLAASHGFFTNARSDAGDVRIYNVTGTKTEVPREIVDYDAVAETGEIHFLADSLLSATDNVFQVEYGDGALTDYAVTGTFGRNAVWTDYDIVYHFSNIAGGEVTNSTGGINGLIVGTITQEDAFINQAIQVRAADSAGVNTQLEPIETYTISGWVKPIANINGRRIFGSFDRGMITWSTQYNWWTSGWDIFGGSLDVDSYSHISMRRLVGTHAIIVKNGVQSGSYVGANSEDLGSGSGLITIGYNAFPSNGSFNSIDVVEFRRATRDLGADHVAIEYANQNDPATFYTLSAEQNLGGGVSLSAETGSYTLSGKTASLLYDRLLESQTGSYSISGKNADLIKGYRIASQAGSFLIDGKDSNLLVSRLLSAQTGSYTINGKQASVLVGYVVPSEKGAYVINGKAADLIVTEVGDFRLTAEKGSYAIGGKQASLIRDYIFELQKGSYSVGGKDANLLQGYHIDAEKGEYVLTGKQVNLLRDYILQLAKGSYVIDGKSADFTIISIGGANEWEISANELYTISLTTEELYIIDTSVNEILQ